MSEILDSDTGTNLGKLSTYQLIGILEEKVRYQPDLKKEAKSEIERRGIPEKKLELLFQKYRDVELLEHENLKYGWPLIFFILISIIFSILLGTIINGIMKSVVIIVSLFGIKIKHKKGKHLEKQLWLKFQIVIFILFCILIGITVISS